MTKSYILTADDVVDNLTSTDQSIPLSANQGRVLNTTKQDIIQVSAMQTAAASHAGKIVQYIGVTTADYTNGYFYQCVLDATTSTYKWVAKNVQAGGGGGGTWGSITGTLSDQTDLQGALDAKQAKSYLVTAFQETPDNDHYPSEKLVKDTVDTKIGATDTATLTNKTIDADSNTISNIAGSNFKTQETTEAGKVWGIAADGTTGLVTGGGTWGSITGTLANQTDLQTALDAKVDTAGTGLSKSGTTLSHSNSVTAQSTQALSQIAFDGQGHITDATALTIPKTGGIEIDSSNQLVHANADITAVANETVVALTCDIKGHITGTSERPIVTSWSAPVADTNIPSEKLVSESLSNKQDTLPTTSTAGKVLKSTSVAGTVEWGDSAGSPSWGGISGTLSDQTDLQTALDGKQASLPTTSTTDMVLGSTSTAGTVQWVDSYKKHFQSGTSEPTSGWVGTPVAGDIYFQFTGW